MTGRVRHVPLGRHESVSRPSAWGRSPRSQRGPAAAGPASHWPWLRERRVGAGSACCTLAMRRSASGTIPALASCCWRTHVRRPSVEPRGRGERVSPLPHLRWRCGVRSAFLRLRDRFQRAERGGPPGGQGGRERADGEGEQDHEGEDAPRGGDSSTRSRAADATAAGRPRTDTRRQWPHRPSPRHPGRPSPGRAGASGQGRPTRRKQLMTGMPTSIGRHGRAGMDLKTDPGSAFRQSRRTPRHSDPERA